MRFGHPLPQRIQNAPELWSGNELYYAGFLDLTSSRPVGWGVGPLSLITMLEYCQVLEIEGEQREDFIWLLTRLDSKYLEWSGRKNGKPGAVRTADAGTG